MTSRIPELAAHRYDVTEAARAIAINVVAKLRNDHGADREFNANSNMHQAVLAEMLSFKDQLDQRIAVMMAECLLKTKARK